METEIIEKQDLKVSTKIFQLFTFIIKNIPNLKRSIHINSSKSKTGLLIIMETEKAKSQRLQDLKMQNLQIIFLVQYTYTIMIL